LALSNLRQRGESGKNVRNDRLLAVARQSLIYSGVAELSDLDHRILKNIEGFFGNYQKLCGVKVKILAHRGRNAPAKYYLKQNSAIAQPDVVDLRAEVAPMYRLLADYIGR
jgi:hypothetical protein